MYLFGNPIGCFSVTQLCLTLCDPMVCSTPDLPVPHNLPKFAQVHVHCIGDAIHPSLPLTRSSSAALSLSQHEGLFQWVRCLHQVTNILELQLRYEAFQWVFRIDFPKIQVLSPYCPRDSQESSPAPQFEGIDSWHSAFFMVQVS